MTKIEGGSNKIILDDGSSLDYDFLAINIGSKTRDTNNVKGVWEHALTTRPINNLLPKIEKKEQELKDAGIVPKVVIIGAGAAGTELSFAFKVRWSKLFEEDIDLTLIGSHESPLYD